MEYKQKFGELYRDAKNKFNIQQAPKLHLKQDKENAEKIFGSTAHYDPQEQTIVIFITNRHPKDILRSFCHEMIHHVQNERGDFDGPMNTKPGYAQEDGHLREMELEAYREGNMMFRDWEDTYKSPKKESLNENRLIRIKVKRK